MSTVRDHLALFWITLSIGSVGLVVAGLWGWNPWLQLVAPLLLMVICTRIFAPVYFGWREPEDYPGRRTRP
jgi:membrane protein implicated in regulation of membrane protease activity